MMCGDPILSSKCCDTSRCVSSQMRDLHEIEYYRLILIQSKIIPHFFYTFGETLYHNYTALRWWRYLSGLYQAYHLESLIRNVNSQKARTWGQRGSSVIIRLWIVRILRSSSRLPGSCRSWFSQTSHIVSICPCSIDRTACIPCCIETKALGATGATPCDRQIFADRASERIGRLCIYSKLSSDIHKDRRVCLGHIRWQDVYPHPHGRRV